MTTERVRKPAQDGAGAPRRRCRTPEERAGLQPRARRQYGVLWDGTPDPSPSRGKCVLDDCADPRCARGLCSKHHARWQRHGDPYFTKRPNMAPRVLGSPEDRFWSKVDASGVCWEWTAGLKSDGYPGFDHQRASRWIYERMVGSIPAGLELDHLCRNRLCVDPDHLEPVTKRVNILRSGNPCANNARKSHCPKGHPYAGNNLVIGKRGDGKEFRQCRTCNREWQRQKKAA